MHGQTRASPAELTTINSFSSSFGAYEVDELTATGGSATIS